MAIRSIKPLITQDKKNILMGVIIYFLFLLLAFFLVFRGNRDYSDVSFFYQILDTVIPLSIPAIISSFIVSFFSKNHMTGIVSVFISGIITIFGLSVIAGVTLFREPISASTWNMFIVLLYVFGFLYIFPTIILSGVFTVLFSVFGSKLSLFISQQKNREST
ncbi:MAG: hypothetical protein ACFE8U_14065 [Candidatus Hermodarchaeota archaeon]